MKKLLTLLIMGAGLGNAQSTVLDLCNQFLAAHCLIMSVDTTISADYNNIWPAANASGVLTNNGIGVLSWQPASGLSVANGFFVTGQSTVGPPNTSVGMQQYFNPSTYNAYLNVYNNVNQPSPFNIGASVVNTPNLNAQGIYNSAGGSTGGYVDQPPITYSGTACTDIWTNPVQFPTVSTGLPSFGANDMIAWNSTSPLYGASSSNCAPSPFIAWNGTSGGQQVTYGLNFNTYIGALGGVASFSPAYNSIQSLTGGLFVGTSVVANQPFYPQGWPSSASLLNPSSGFLNYIDSATYTSGGTITGAAGTYCAVGPFNGGVAQAGAQGLVTLTGTNTIAGGTSITFVNPTSGAWQGGQLYTSNPTQGYLNNGSNVVWPGHTPANCSGIATISSHVSPIYYGGFGYKSGSIYWYWNGSSWQQVDLSATGDWTLSGTNLFPVSTSYKVEVGESTNLTGANLEINGSVSTLANGFYQAVGTGSGSGNKSFQTADGSGHDYFLVDFAGNVSLSGQLNAQNILTTGSAAVFANTSNTQPTIQISNSGTSYGVYDPLTPAGDYLRKLTTQQIDASAGVCVGCGYSVQSSNLAGSTRVIGAVYSNSATYGIFVVVGISLDSSGHEVEVQSDSSGSPSQVVGVAGGASGVASSFATIAFVVAPGNNYIVSNLGGGSASLISWTEYH